MSNLPISLIPENIYTPPQRKRRNVIENSSPVEEESSDVITTNASHQTEQNATEQNVSEQNATEQNASEQNASEQNVESELEEVVVSLSSQNIEHTLSLRELRQRCIDKGLTASGKKSDLVGRLLAAQ